jgi:hypothetical protein
MRRSTRREFSTTVVTEARLQLDKLRTERTTLHFSAPSDLSQGRHVRPHDESGGKRDHEKQGAQYPPENEIISLALGDGRWNETEKDPDGESSHCWFLSTQRLSLVLLFDEDAGSSYSFVHPARGAVVKEQLVCPLSAAMQSKRSASRASCRQVSEKE